MAKLSSKPLSLQGSNLRYIGPDVAGQIDEDGVDSTASIEDGSHVVIMFDLGGALQPLQPQAAQELVGKTRPVSVGIGHIVRIEIAGCASELCTMAVTLSCGQGKEEGVSGGAGHSLTPCACFLFSFSLTPGGRHNSHPVLSFPRPHVVMQSAACALLLG